MVCGDYLIGKRSDVRYCSDACRQAQYRQRRDYVAGAHIPNAAQWKHAAAEAQRLLERAARELGESRS